MQALHAAATKTSCRRGCAFGCACSQHAQPFRARSAVTCRAVSEPAAKPASAIQLAPAAGASLVRTAMAVSKPGAPFESFTWTAPELGFGEVDINPSHNGLCHSDLHMSDDDWGLTVFPFVGGHEVVGTVAAVGPGVRHIKVGDRVGAAWIKNSCRVCPCCVRGEDNICSIPGGYTGLIVGKNQGGFATSVRAVAEYCYPIPEGLSSSFAAPLLCAGVTVYAPLERYVRPGSRVAIVGIGGLGHLAVQFASRMGAVVTAVIADFEGADKMADAEGFGASACIHSSELFGPKYESAFDVVLNTSPIALDAGPMVRTLAPGGTLVQIGIPGGNPSLGVPLNDLVFGQRSVAGSIVGGRSVMGRMLAFATAKKVFPLIEEMPLSKINEAAARLRAGKPKYRIVLLTDVELKKA